MTNSTLPIQAQWSSLLNVYLSMKTIPLSKGKVALVDDEDFEQVSKVNWCLKKSGYVTGYSNGKHVSMHRVIMKAKKGQTIDHKDHNGLNNQKSNLRFCTLSQNCANQKARGGTSKYKGVSRRKDRPSWRVLVRCNGRRFYCGSFKCEKQAAKAYDKKAKEVHGEFALLNFPNS